MVVDRIRSIGTYGQPFALICAAFSISWYFFVDDTFALSRVLIGLLLIYTFFGTFMIAPYKAWPWHLIAYSCNVAIIATLYYWFWDNSIPLRFFWYGSIATSITMNLYWALIYTEIQKQRSEYTDARQRKIDDWNFIAVMFCVYAGLGLLAMILRTHS